MSNTIDDPDELHDLAAFAMKHAMHSIQPRGPLIPFVIMEDESGRELVRFVADRLEVMQALARLRLAEGPAPARAVLAWDGYSNLTGRRGDTMFVEAYERGAAGGILIAQPYESKGLLRKRNDPVGPVGVCERGRPPLF